jgi:hypothetical protein
MAGGRQLSLFKFERSALRRIGLAFLSEDGRSATPAVPAEGAEDQGDPYLSQTARLLSSGRPYPPVEPNEAG